VGRGSYLNYDRNAVKRATNSALHSFVVQMAGDGEKESFRSSGDHGIELQAIGIVTLNLTKEGLDDLYRGDPACREELPQLGTVCR